MGLSIDTYSSSYRTLHVLRQFALDVEENPVKLWCYDYGDSTNCGKCVYCLIDDNPSMTKFHEFINHSDCDGGYISYSQFGIDKSEMKIESWGDLDKLKEEVEELDKRKDLVPDGYRDIWADFVEDVRNADHTLTFH